MTEPESQYIPAGYFLISPGHARLVCLLINEVRRFKGREGVTTNQEVFELERTLKRDPILTTSHPNNVTDETPLYEFIDTKKAARRLGITPHAAAALARRGTITGHKSGGQWLLASAEVQARAERRRNQAA
ncbi:helix-turn-helix domain-containing protein [Corynebacterium antarcticum]|uniref:helix-turn-helix domain-containing protein n=1 Tax=Corynebacterium antarcticum TaxID=2800405 RepID=UPI0020064B8C|nr:helix-turn-helix domain-containing protein [Corynebacterium antarcticum]MCK7661298.1 helix-turn-helix domain-containing protein [Corynebacterium antarcticum]